MQNQMVDVVNPYMGRPHPDSHQQHDDSHPNSHPHPLGLLDDFIDMDEALLSNYFTEQSIPFANHDHTNWALRGFSNGANSDSIKPINSILPLDNNVQLPHTALPTLCPIAQFETINGAVPSFNGGGNPNTSDDAQAPETSAAAASSSGTGPRRRTRRRQNISCDQCRASKRGCDFQLKLDADGNDVTQSTSSESAANPIGIKRKAKDVERDIGSKANPVCSNCQRRGIECTTNFADSVRNSKQQAMAAKEMEPAPNTNVVVPSKKRLINDGNSVFTARSGSVSSEAGSTAESFAGSPMSPRQQMAGAMASLSWHGPNSRFAHRADSLSLTTNRMRLYVTMVEPNANLWLSRACSPLRSEGDLGAFIKSAIATNALDMSQKLWASWHVDTVSTHRDHQPNLFYLVFGLDHLGEELGVWGEKLRPVNTDSPQSRVQVEGESVDDALNAASAGFYERMQEITGYGPGGWRRSERDLMIDEAIKAAMLAYACQFRLDGDLTPADFDLEDSQGTKAKDAHDRVSTAAWKKARSLLLQLAPRRSCRVAFGLFLFGVTAPPEGALAEGGINSGSDATEDAAFAFETATRHLEWFIKRCRELVTSVEEAAQNPLLAHNPEVLRQRRMANDLMGLAESLGWFGLLIDTVSSVSLRRKAAMREDALVDRPTGLSAALFGNCGSGGSPTSSQTSSSPPDQSAAALFAILETLDLLPGRQAPPGAFPGTSMSYTHDDNAGGDGEVIRDTEMSKRILERAACARDLIPALLRNPGAISNAIPFDVLLGGGDGKDSANPTKLFGPAGMSEQVVLLGIAWGTAVEVYIWRRINALQILSEPLLTASSPVSAFIKGGGTFVDEKKEKLINNVLDSINLFHSIFDSLISKAHDDFFLFGRQSRSMLAMFVLHMHLGVLHFTRVAKELENKENELAQQFNHLNLSEASQSPLDHAGVANSAERQPNVRSPSTPLTSPGLASSHPLRSKMAATSFQRRLVGKKAAEGMACITHLLNLESSMLEQGKINAISRHNQDVKSRRSSLGLDPISASIEESASAPWRHPYPLLVVDALKLSAQQLHDELWDQLLTVPRNQADFNTTLGHLDTCLDGLGRTIRSVPALESYRQGLKELKSARDTVAYVATTQQ